MQDDYLKKLFESVPRSAEDLERIREEVGQNQQEKLMDRALKQNDRIMWARKTMRMFESEEFKQFWNMVHGDVKQQIEMSVLMIKGTPMVSGGYDPLGQLAQLNNIQGGLEALESQSLQMKVIEEIAKGKEVDINELKAKLAGINPETSHEG